MLACLRRRRGVEALIELVVALACAAHARCTRGHNAIAHRPAGTRAGAGRRQQRQGGSGAAGGTVAVAVGGHSEALRASGSTTSRASARGVPRPPPHPLRARDRAAHRRCLGAVGQTRGSLGRHITGRWRSLADVFQDRVSKYSKTASIQKASTLPTARRATSPPLRPEPQHPPQLSPNSSPQPTPSHQTPAPRVPTPPVPPACVYSFSSFRPSRAVGGRTPLMVRATERNALLPYTFACASAGPCKRDGNSAHQAVLGCSSALHHLDLRGAAARLDAAAAPRGVLLDQDLREVIRGGVVGASVRNERIVARGSEKAGSRHVEAAGSTEQRWARRVEIRRRSGRRRV